MATDTGFRLIHSEDGVYVYTAPGLRALIDVPFGHLTDTPAFGYVYRNRGASLRLVVDTTLDLWTGPGDVPMEQLLFQALSVLTAEQWSRLRAPLLAMDLAGWMLVGEGWAAEGTPPTGQMVRHQPGARRVMACTYLDDATGACVRHVRYEDGTVEDETQTEPEDGWRPGRDDTAVAALDLCRGRRI